MPRVSPFVWIVSALMVLALILLLVFSSCVPPEQSETPTAAGTFATKTELQALQNVVSQKADNTAVDAVSRRVDSVNTRIDNLSGAGAAAGYTKAETYTKAEVDALIAKLKSDQSWITGSGGSSTPPPPAGGSVTVITSPTNVQVLGSTQVCYTAKIQNTYNNWVYVRPILTINAATGQSPVIVTSCNVTISVGGTAISLSNANFQFTPTLPTATAISSITAIPISGGNGNGEMQIAANTTVDLLICIQISAANPIIWNIGTSVNARTL